MGGAQNDGIFGNGGDDVLLGGSEDDWIVCGGSPCYARGEKGNDRIEGGGGADELFGDSGSDFILGGAGDDWIYGGTEPDFLFGLVGADHLYGEAGNDLLSGGLDIDTFDGGTGTDTFYCRNSAHADPWFDPANADTDCSEHPTFWGDRGMEYTEGLDPYLGWVRRFERTINYGPDATSSISYDVSFHTTSSASRLMSDVNAGAHIVLQGAGDPLHTRRIQSDNTCGPQSLEMVLRQLGYTDEQPAPWQLLFTRDISSYPSDPGSWVSLPGRSWDPAPGGAHEFLVSVGYRYSVEHIVLDALSQLWWFDRGHFPMTGSCDYLFPDTDELNNRDDAGGDWRRVDYAIGDYDPLLDPPPPPPTPPGDGPLQVWDFCSPGIGMNEGDEDALWFGRQLPGVANRAADDAGHDRDAEVVTNEMITSIDHFEAIVAGFIDHGIPLLVGVERGGHFNTIIGYWDTGYAFYLYTADPLDGSYRPYSLKPMRWQRFVVTQSLLDSRVLTGLMLFDHVTAGGCDPGEWADEIDDSYGPLLCD